MPKRPNDPILADLSKEANDLPLPYREPNEAPRGLLFFQSGRGVYTFLRLLNRTFLLGTFSSGREAAAQQYADACRLWFKPYIRRRPSVESPDALYNFSEAEAQQLLSTVPGLEALLCRLENHLQANYGLQDRDAASAEKAEQRALRRSPSRRAAAQLDCVVATQAEHSAALSHLAKQQLAFQQAFASLDLFLRTNYAAK